MPRSRVAYPPEFRQRLIELVACGRGPEELAEKEFEPSAQTIRNWVKRAEVDGGKRRDVLEECRARGAHETSPRAQAGEA